MKSYHDIAGDGGSRIAEQVGGQRRRMARSLAEVRHMVAVGSGKGGVGKSTLTLQLASLLAAEGHRVAIFDADLNGPSQARLADVEGTPLVPEATGLALPRSRHGFGVVSVGSIVRQGQAVDFASVSSGSTHVWRATREFTAAAELLGAVAWGALDLLLFDLPPGAERTFQWAEFLGPRTAIVLVTLPSELSQDVVSRSLAALKRTGNPILGYVVNMHGYYCQECDELKPLFPVTSPRTLDIPCLGSLPFDPQLAAVTDRGDGLSHESRRPIVRALRRLASRVVDALEKTQ